MLGRNFTFLQDNGPKHKAKDRQKWLKQKGACSTVAKIQI